MDLASIQVMRADQLETWDGQLLLYPRSKDIEADHLGGNGFRQNDNTVFSARTVTLF